MTPHPQQENPSYPVTWTELRNIYADGLSLDKYDEIILRKTCSSHSSLPAAPACPHWGIEHSDGIEWVCDKTALSLDAATIRNQTLNEIAIELQEVVDVMGIDNPVSQAYIAVIEMCKLKKIAESLRTPSTKEQP